MSYSDFLSSTQVLIKNIKSNQTKMVYTLVVHLHAKEGKDVEDKIRNKIIEASQTYMKDAEVIGWYVMQDHADTRKWAIIERYERESVRRILTTISVLIYAK
ncbi:Antibiotic biosynthesis monooxygenase protein [Phytophthora megakarya]|uniref:Antibiotic biosynthesis monooxygenase protein n=1 Tax=Phytophthora megakarya TaxID=4795 RepID=A0A225VYW5_9STRA|nr:Antibiotic biosynthesis monooxygenase protein [Phytophthora megakarya]